MVDRPQAISDFFSNSNSIDKNNHARQSELALEEKWVTQNCYFRLVTTLVGLNVTDAWMLMHHHNLYDIDVKNRYTTCEQRKVPIKPFAGMLSGQLLHMATQLEVAEDARLKRTRNDFDNANDSSFDTDEEGIDDATNNDQDYNNQYVTFDDGKGRILKYCTIVRDVTDGNGNNHQIAKFPVMIGKNNRRRGMVKQCQVCKKLTTCFCVKCMTPFCHSITNKHSRGCFIDHIPGRTSSRNSNDSL